MPPSVFQIGGFSRFISANPDTGGLIVTVPQATIGESLQAMKAQFRRIINGFFSNITNLDLLISIGFTSMFGVYVFPNDQAAASIPWLRDHIAHKLVIDLDPPSGWEHLKNIIKKPTTAPSLTPGPDPIDWTDILDGVLSDPFDTPDIGDYDPGPTPI